MDALQTVQVTFYLCALGCGEKHSSEDRAVSCCLCEDCGKVKGSERGGYRWRCDSCHKRAQVKSVASRIEVVESRLVRAQQDVARLNRELAELKANLDLAKKLPTNKANR